MKQEKIEESLKKLKPEDLEHIEQSARIYTTVSVFNNFATKEDLNKVEHNLKEDINKVEQKIDKVEHNLKEDINKVDQKIDKVEHNLNEKIDKVEQKLEKRMDRLEDHLISNHRWQVGTIITILVTGGGILVKLFMGH